jgi:hypothetical protein
VILFANSELLNIEISYNNDIKLDQGAILFFNKAGQLERINSET